MPIEPFTEPFGNEQMRLLSGFRTGEPPFAFGNPDPHPLINRVLAHDAVDAVCDFVESGESCWSRDYSDSLDPEMARRASCIAEAELKAVAPHGVTVVRRASEVFLLRR